MRFVFPTLERARHVHNEMQDWFGVRSPSGDDAALTIHLRERLFPDCLAEHVDNPGDLNEPDIAMALYRSFRGDQVLLNPIRADNRLEFVDVLVATSKTVLLIQAKDSPSTDSENDPQDRHYCQSCQKGGSPTEGIHQSPSI